MSRHHFAAVPQWAGLSGVHQVIKTPHRSPSGDILLAMEGVFKHLRHSSNFEGFVGSIPVHPTRTYQIPPLSRYGTLKFGVLRLTLFEDLSWSFILGRYALRSLSELWIWLLSSMQSALGSVWTSSQWFAFTWLQKQPETNILYKCKAMVRIQNATYTDAFWMYWPKHLILDV